MGDALTRIGMIYPASGLMENEFVRMAPTNVSVHITRIHFETASVEENLRMIEKVEDASRLLALAKVQLILFNCTTGSLIGGRSYDESIIAKIERATGIPAMTTATAVVLALQKLDVRKIGLIAPYPRDITQIEEQFLEQSGFEVIWAHAEDISDPRVQSSVSPSRWIELGRDLPPNADGLFISCGGIQIVDHIKELEGILNRPVVTSNQASMWACLKKLGIRYTSPRFGKLVSDT